MPPYWWVAPALVAVLCGWCVAMWAWHTRKARRAFEPYDVEDDACACDNCWPGTLDALVAAYDWKAAEQQMPRKLRRQP